MASSPPTFPTCHPIREYLHGTKTAQDVLEYLQDVALYPTCRTVSGKDTKCTCLHLLRPCPNDPPILLGLWRFVLHYSSLNKATRQTMAMQWIRCAETIKSSNKGGEKRRVYVLPVKEDSSADSDEELTLEDMNHKVCQSSLQRVLDIGRKAWETLKHAVDNDTLPFHGLKGKESNRSMRFHKGIKEDLVAYFKELEEIAQAGEGDILELPSGLSKRGRYREWCLARGWIVKAQNAKGGFGKIVNAQPREFNQDDWPVGSQQKPICSWAKFTRFWKEKFPNLWTRDVCGDKYKASKKDENDNVEDSSVEDESDRALEDTQTVALNTAQSVSKRHHPVAQTYVQYQTPRLPSVPLPEPRYPQAPTFPPAEYEYSPYDYPHQKMPPNASYPR